MSASKLLETISLTWAYYNRGTALQDAVLKMYAEDLSDLDANACIQAYAHYRRNPANRTFPLPAQIRELVCPEQFVSVEVQAREIAARIVGAITKFGWCNGKEAQVYIGPEGWQAVQRSGGWAHLCQNTGVKINPTTLQAQLRDQLEGALRYGTSAIEQSIGAKSLRESSELTPIGDVMKLLGKSENDTEGDAS